MEDFLSWLGWAAAALLLVGVVVAGWEHLVREARACDRERKLFISQQPQTARHAAVTVDVRLDTQAAALYAAPAETSTPAVPSAESEHAARISVMTSVLSRASAARLPQPEHNQWLDTTPRVIGLNEPAVRDSSDEGNAAAGADPGGHRSDSQRD